MSQDFNEYELECLEAELRDSLNLYQVKTPSTKDTLQLINRLQLEEEKLEEELFVTPFSNPVKRLSLLKQFFLQLRTTKWPIWVISVVFMVMLTLLVEPVEKVTYYYNQPFTLFLPLMVLGGIFYMYKTWNKEMRLVEMVTPFPPVLLLFSRLFVILLILITMAFSSSIYLFLAVEEFMLIGFIMSWLAPTVFFIGVLTFLIYWKGPMFGFITSFVLWLLLIVNIQSFVMTATFANKYAIIHGATFTLGVALIIFTYCQAIRSHKGVAVGD